MTKLKQKFYFVYILNSVNYPEKYYTGFTEDVVGRLDKHNNGEVKYTSGFKPWKIKTVVSFADKSKALLFEKYLKTQSGRAFAKKRL